MSAVRTVALTTEVALGLIAHERAPRHKSQGPNRRVVCSDGFAVSVQASVRHYANDSSAEAPYWRYLDGEEPVYPFTTFEGGKPVRCGSLARRVGQWGRLGLGAARSRRVPAGPPRRRPGVRGACQPRGRVVSRPGCVRRVVLAVQWWVDGWLVRLRLVEREP